LNSENKQALKTALVTGGARRIGAAIVRQLHEANFQVILHCHHSYKEGEVLVQELNHKRRNSAFLVVQNLHESNAANTLIKMTLNCAHRLDLLVNNASMFTPSNLRNEENWDKLFAINVKLPFLLSLAARASLKASQGAIINITDIHAVKPLKGYSVYCQTKAALLMQTKSLAREFAPEIRVNAIAPGSIMWPEHENALSEQTKKKIIANTPLKQHGVPGNIAQAVLSLTENPFITGQMLSVDGGRSIV
jgi:pteridine reductase